MARRIYVETSIPSFYFEIRTEAVMVARKDWTREWWQKSHGIDDLVTSVAVIEELEAGEFQSRESCLQLIRSLPLLAIEPPVLDIVDTYIKRHLMPSDPAGDALHLALASYHRCDFLLTWNCQHLANANKFDHIRRVNTMLGLFVPALVTPLELIEEDDT